MYPFYGHMESYPHMRDQSPYPPLHPPTLDTLPPHYMEGISPVTYESWPYGMNYGYPYPMGCHGCCNHNYFPGYYNYRPPYHHIPPPPNYYHPFHYNPPPHYSVDHSKHADDINVPREFHCSGCPNQSCSKKEDQNVKIKDQDPDIEKRSDSSLVPIQFKNYPFPVVLIPPDDMKSKEAGETKDDYDGDPKKMDGGDAKKADENVVQKLIPVEVEKGEKKQGKKDNNEPNKPLESGTKKESSSSKKASKLPPVCLRVDPLPMKKNSNGSSRSPSPPGNRTQSEGLNNEKSKTPSPQKMQSLERIERNQQVGEKEKRTKTIQVVDATNTDKKIEDSHKQALTNQTTKKGGESVIVEQDKMEPAEAKKVDLEGLSVEEKCDIGEDRGANDAKEDKSLIQERELGRKRKNLSDGEAAVMIQSAYRGFEVRKWEPLKKLKQIARVTEQMAEVKSRIKTLEDSADNGSDDKQRVVIGETIMSLLLNLDAIQGLHPCVREIRKSVAKELVRLQEKLDALPVTKVEASIDVASAEKPVEDLPNNDKADEELTVTGPDGISSDTIVPCPGQPLLMTKASSSSEALETTELNVDSNVFSDFEDRSAEVPVACAEESVACDATSKKIDSSSLIDPKDYEVTNIIQVPMVQTQENHEEKLELESSLEHSQPAVPEEKVVSEVVELSKEASPQQGGMDVGHLVELLEESNDKCSSDENSDLFEETRTESQELQGDDYPVMESGVVVDKEGSEKYEKIQDECPVDSLKEEVVDNDVTQALVTEEPHKESHDMVKEDLNIKEKVGKDEEDDHPTNESRVVGDKAEKYEKIQDECPVDSLKEEIVDTNLTRALRTDEPHEDNPFHLKEVSVGEFEESRDMEKEDLNVQVKEMVETDSVPLEGKINMESEIMLMEENAKLREMVEKLVEAGRQQLTAISDLSGKVSDLEKKMTRRKKLKTRRLAK